MAPSPEFRGNRPTEVDARVTLVTGAAGFAGGHLLDLLAGDGAAVVAWRRPGGTIDSRDREPPAGGPPQPDSRADRAHVSWQAVDLLDGDAVRSALGKIRPDVVYHCAGAAHVGRSWSSTESTFAINVRGTHHLIEGLRALGLRARVLVPSSALVYSPTAAPLREDDRLAPASPYALSKLAQELLGRGNPAGPDVLIARAFNHFGPRQDPWFVASGFARRIADIEAGRWAPEISVGNLDARRDLTDVRDTVRAYALMVARGAVGRPYNVCTGRAIAIRDLLDIMLARAKVPIAIRVDPARYRPNDVPVLVGDPTRIQQELGWTPQIPLERTVDDLLTFWRNSQPLRE
jgi:GDP-4-dehydro-6-deoxy-D-mannose reductase